MRRGTMGRRFRIARVALAASLALAGLAFSAAPAQAIFHLMKIREVYPGTSGATHNDAFIELQMFAAGQNFVAGHEVTTYGPAGGTPHSYPIPGNVPNGESQRTILIGGSAVGDSDADFQDVGLGPAISPSGGAVCFPDAEPPDCVSWGNFTGNASLPPPGAGTPVAPAGIPDGSSIERSIAPNCPTLLENADDTNDSLTDFGIAAPTPRNNATAPTETPCTGGGGGGPDTTITKKPKDKTKKKRVTYAFTSSVAGATFQCSENGKPFHTCTSPHTFRAKKGKNRFEVRAVDAAGNVDQTPADDRFKRKKRKR
jgi:hypothetical protein